MPGAKMKFTVWYESVRYEVESEIAIEKNDKNEIIAFIDRNKVLSSTKLKEDKNVHN